jgi:hypothetical protein
MDGIFERKDNLRQEGVLAGPWTVLYIVAFHCNVDCAFQLLKVQERRGGTGARLDASDVMLNSSPRFTTELALHYTIRRHCRLILPPVTTYPFGLKRGMS